MAQRDPDPACATELSSQAIPPEVYHVKGCTCGGGVEWHREDCAIFAVPMEQRLDALTAARQRLRKHADDRTRRLRAAIATAQQEE